MRTSASAFVLSLISISIAILASDALFPELLFSDVEASSTAIIDAPPTLATPVMTTVLAPTPIIVEPVKEPTAVTAPIVPARLSIPSVGIDSTVIGVGTNEKGEMDVPDGNTSDVGWYKHGVKPGAAGTAVFDAHVFAAFKNLAQTKVGDDIYVSASDGTRLHFRVTRVATYALADLSPSTLFAPSATRDINLITCAGTYDKAQGTYDHRTIVSATLVD